MIDTIIFDGEGVIIDTETMWDRGQEEFLRRHGHTYDRENLKPLLTGRTVREGVEIMQREYGIPGDVEQLARERVEIVKDRLRDGVSYVPGFLDFFARIEGRYKTCIATSMPGELLDIVNATLNLEKLFDGNIFTVEQVGNRSKPDPDIFLYAAKRLGSSVKTCLVIEDAPHGVEAAKRGGMMCIGLTTTYSRERLAAADLVVNSFVEINLEELDKLGETSRRLRR